MKIFLLRVWAVEKGWGYSDVMMLPRNKEPDYAETMKKVKYINSRTNLGGFKMDGIKQVFFGKK